MLKKITAPRIFTGVLLLFLITITVCALVLPSLGFFQAIFRATGFNSAKVELIFDRLTVTDELAALGYDSSKEWGSEANPYVISQKYHVQNLSVLQNNGFFKEKKDDDGDPIQSYFLVCGQDGKPVAIDCGGMTLAPVGTHENPFTGVIKGAPLAGETAYNGYGTAVSAIANLTVSASVSEPDIGFFGCIGYHGTADTDDATGAPIITDGYAANISNLLLADVTIESRVSWTDTLAKWWESFGGHKRTDDQEETHHIGIVAGHAEFATIADISVFYSSDTIKTFDLASTGTTSYYSITGLVGMLEHVNPAAKDGNLIGGAGNSVSDGDMLIEGGFGGGGAISGSLTGYMMAETLYNEHESVLKEQDTDHTNGITGISANGIYDVKAMLKHDDDGSIVSLFETVMMKERESAGLLGNEPWEEVDYYVFRDTVFTFAMSTSEKDIGQTTNDGTPVTDYVKKIWKLEDGTPTVSTTSTSGAWQYLTDNSVDPTVSYKLTAITSAPTNNGGYYLLTYHDKGTNPAHTEEGHKDDKLYVFEIKSSAISDSDNTASCTELDYEDFLQGNIQVGDTTYKIEKPRYDDNGNLIELSITGENRKYQDYAFLNNSNKIIANPETSSYGALGIQASCNGGYGYNSPQLVVNIGSKNTSVTANSSNTAQVYEWIFSPNNGKFAIYQNFDFSIKGSLIGVTLSTYYGYGKLGFDTTNKVVTFDADYSTSERPDIGQLDYCFTIFQVNTNTVGSDGRITTLGEGNQELTPMNIVATGTTTNFDASKYVLEQQFNANGAPILDANGNPTYALAPIRSYNLNSGRGTYIDQLNHVVKLFRATEHNFQMTISNTFLGGLFGDALDTNSGGIVGTQIGVSDPAVYASIPTGMIAFNITEASDEKPSYINIIVAVNPGQTDVSKIGLWYMEDDDSWSDSFDINSPTQAFTLPISKVAANAKDSKYVYTISQNKQYAMQNGAFVLDENGNPTYVDSATASYAYFGGQTVLVYHSFEVTDAGTYLLGSAKGPMSVAYFSVSGAAGTGADGSSASPLGNIDFVYANNNNIITVDNKFDGLQNVENEDHTLYYPSYHFVLMIPADTDTGKVQQETIKIYRYLTSSTATTRDARHIKILGCNKAQIKRLADMYQDVLEDGTQNSS